MFLHHPGLPLTLFTYIGYLPHFYFTVGRTGSEASSLYIYVGGKGNPLEKLLGKSYCDFCATRSQYSGKFNLFYKLIYFNWIELIIEYQMDRLDNRFGYPLGVSFKNTISPLLLTPIILYWSLFFLFYYDTN